MSKILDTQKLLIDGSLKLTEIVEEKLGEIEKKDDLLNSFITVCDSQARETAAKLQAKIDQEGIDEVVKQYPLLGSVYSAKDMYLTKGIKTTAGSKILENYVPQYDSTVIKRLNEAGSILIGKTNQDAWAHGSSGENSDFGPTKNPWDPTLVPGGSSSGSAVSVAASMCDFSMGTDTGGSVRLPASFCGVSGLKPTYGSVSRYGVVAMASSLDSMGSIASEVSDLEIVYNRISGPDAKDATIPNNISWIEKKDRLRIGIPKEYFSDGLDKQIESLVKDSIAEFERLGHEIVDVSLPHTEYAVAAYYIICPAEVSSNLGRYDGVRFGKGREYFGAEAKRRIMLGSYVLSSGYYDAYYKKGQEVRGLISQDFKEVFEKVDIVLTPVSPVKPFKIGEKINDPLSMYLADVYTVAINMAQLPALSMPCGFVDGLPVGFQIVGPKFSEKMLFDLGKNYQKQTNWHTFKPKK